MALSTPLDIIKLALKVSGVNGVGQGPSDEDVNDAFDILNSILSEWQISRWSVYDLVDVSLTSTAALSYTVGPTGDFVFPGQRPDKIDAAFARLIATGADSYLYPFMSREGYDRVPVKSAPGIPESFFYDAANGPVGTIFIYPVPPATYSLHVQAKASLGQFAALTDTVTLPRPYVTAMLWELAVAMRPLFQMEPDAVITAKAVNAMRVLGGSIAQVPQVVQAAPSNRAGVYSSASP